MNNDYSKLIELIIKAKGNRSINRFAEDCGIDAGHLSRIMRGKMINPPNPDTLKKISEKAQNFVSYEALMHAAGHLQKKFIGSNLAILRKDMTYEAFSVHLKKQLNIDLSPWLLERYEHEKEQPDDVIVDCLAALENLKTEFFYQVNNEITMNEMRRPESTPERPMPKLSSEILAWLGNKENHPYIEFIYNAYKAGITRDLLEKAEISIRIK